MNLHAKLLEREAAGRPVRVGLIGAGKFAAMYLAQVPRTPGVHLAAIADLSPDNARANLGRVGWPAASFGAASIDAALTLVPEGWAWMTMWIGVPFSEGTADLWIPTQRAKGLRQERFRCGAKTPALALCIAALRARETS